MAHQTRLLFDQLDAFQRAGQWHSALSLCDRLFQQAWRSKDPTELVDIIIRTAFFHASAGDSGAAIDAFEAATSIAQLNGDSSQAARALNGMGIILQRLGDIEEAENYYLLALKNVKRTTNRTSRGDILNNLGIIANIRGDIGHALERYEQAYSQYEETAERSRIARVLNNIGMLHIDMGNVADAETSLGRALNIARSIPDYPVEGIIHTNRAELYLVKNDLDAARGACDQAYEIASRLEDDDLKSAVLKFYGMIYRARGQMHLSESYLDQARDLAAAVDNVLIQAEIAREHSLLYREADRNREALGSFIAAHNLFSRLQAENDTADIAAKLQQLESDFHTLVLEWGESIEAKDRYTSGHCKRVAYYACDIAKEAGLSDLEMSWFRMGAFLHDVGKTETPEEILNKPGKLTPEERAIIENHTVAGDEMLSSIEFPWDIRPMVRSHHERWDGGGYPDGLSALDIPHSARILKIADVFDALTTNRSYRKPMSMEEALAIMEGDEGAFDPELFEIFLQLLPRWAMTEFAEEDGFVTAAS